MPRFEHIFFVCTNTRDAGSAQGSCQARGGAALLGRLKELTQEHKLKGKVRITASGCLDFCAKGCAVAAFSARQSHPETWYTRVTLADADALFESHVLKGEPLQRLVEASADSRIKSTT